MNGPIVGVLGAGQLGRMLALAGLPMGVRFRFYDAAADSPAGHVAPLVVGQFDDAARLAAFAEGLEVATLEFENVPAEAARFLAERVEVLPGPQALEAAQDRLAEKMLFGRLGIETAPFEPVASRQDLERAVARVGLPGVLKTRRFGYDGKGQMLLRVPEDVAAAWATMGGPPLIYESFVEFDREVSILAVRGGRGRRGEVRCYPLVENHHRAGILRLSIAPAPRLDPRVQEQAEGHARAVLEALGYIGVVAIEFFQLGERLLANEMAPRVHNSGHWTIEGSQTSQFENHVRAVLGLPLGPTGMVGGQRCAMLNLIGALPAPEEVLSIPDAHLHLYGKELRPGRKLGHITVRACDEGPLRERVRELTERLGL